MTPQERQTLAQLAKTIKQGMLALGYAVDDIEAGLWTPAELENLAGTMDLLARQLRSAAGERSRVVVESVRADR
ncbi:hypothetical protein SAMN05421805_104174 [Saccharopolyspora antimicrobica]|uniref:Uncharacterized protein n=2 Tax=Saccharopolyspora antimicrobica TaxID=455193 RepID=A0A1I4YK96_9PSEU|nr:hypothetical protein ATL45_0958 [Saccharopolyspora antimicrobica]SFN38203.1 hypothetical protein SAMN05421805_104174 [Saccharopolyspora antimicrobica]